MGIKGSFGGRKPYFADFEMADDITPDPFSEEPHPHSTQHDRHKLAARNPKPESAEKNKQTEA